MGCCQCSKRSIESEVEIPEDTIEDEEVEMPELLLVDNSERKLTNYKSTKPEHHSYASHENLNCSPRAKNYIQNFITPCKNISSNSLKVLISHYQKEPNWVSTSEYKEMISDICLEALKELPDSDYLNTLRSRIPHVTEQLTSKIPGRVTLRQFLNSTSSELKYLTPLKIRMNLLRENHRFSALDHRRHLNTWTDESNQPEIQQGLIRVRVNLRPGNSEWIQFRRTDNYKRVVKEFAAKHNMLYRDKNRLISCLSKYLK